MEIHDAGVVAERQDTRARLRHGHREVAEPRHDCPFAADPIRAEARNPTSRPLLFVGLMLVLLLFALYGTVFRDLIQEWWDDANYSHGFLVPLFSAFLVWRQRSDLIALPTRGSWLGLPLLIVGLASLVLGDVASENFLMRSSLIVVLAALILIHLGSAFLRALLMPLLFLFFMLPLPVIVFNALALPLQTVAAQSAAWALYQVGVPVLLDGNVIHLSQVSLGVTEACSGIRSLISLLAVAVAWSTLTLPGICGMLALGVAVVPITVLANAGRVVATGLISQWFGVDYAQGFFHTFSGWLVFVLAFVCLAGVHRILVSTRARWAGVPL